MPNFIINHKAFSKVKNERMDYLCVTKHHCTVGDTVTLSCEELKESLQAQITEVNGFENGRGNCMGICITDITEIDYVA